MNMNEVEKSRLLPVRAEKVSGRLVAEKNEERHKEAVEVGRRRRPRTVAKVVVGRAHSQILRIRAEDSRVGEDGFCGTRFMLFSRHMLPASPLGSKNAANSRSRSLTSGP